MSEEKKEMRLSPAGLGALMNGDLENFIVASTPGGIEAQEAQGQRDLVASETLPTDCTREVFEAMGIVFGEKADDIFTNVTLPTGWKKVATDHDMHSDLVDDKGRKRAGIFYKAAFYDRSAHMNAVTRFRAASLPEDRWKTDMSFEERDKGNWFGIAWDGDEEVYVTEPVAAASWEDQTALSGKAKQWLDEKYPGWTDTSKHWD